VAAVLETPKNWPPQVSVDSPFKVFELANVAILLSAPFVANNLLADNVVN
jgi:hypothetical protein